MNESLIFLFTIKGNEQYSKFPFTNLRGAKKIVFVN